MLTVIECVLLDASLMSVLLPLLPDAFNNKVVKFDRSILKVSVKVATSLAIFTPSDALNVNVPDVAVPAESWLNGVIVNTDESLETVAMLSKPTSVTALNVIGNPSESVAVIVMTVVVVPSFANVNGDESPAAV